MKKTKGLKGLIIFGILCILVIGVYIYLANREYETPEVDASEIMTEVQEVLSRNLNTDYPPTPKELVKYAYEINRAYYNEEHTDDELAALVRQERLLYDEELLSYNSEYAQFEEIKLEIAQFKEEGYYISDVSISQSLDVETFMRDGSEWAKLHAKYTIRKGSVHYITDYTYLLRKDAEGHWKIYGWEVSADESNE